MSQLTTSKDTNKGKPRESTLVSLVINILIPVVILTTLSDDDQLGAVKGLIIALALPLGYSLYYAFRQRGVSFFAALGIVGVLFIGGIGLLKLNAGWIAVKEGAIPLIIAVAIIVYRRIGLTVVKVFLSYVINMEKVYKALRETGNVTTFERQLNNITYILASLLVLSAVLNYWLAKIIVVSESGTTAFNEELGRLMALEIPVIVIPLMIGIILMFRYLVSSIKQLTNCRWKDIRR